MNSILITGCNGGIGSCLVDAFFDAGWNVVGVDRTPIRESAPRRHFIEADIGAFVSSPSELEAFRSKVLEACAGAPLKVLINNAAVQHLGGLEALTTADIVESLHVNVAAPMLLAKTFLPELKNDGVIINIGSVHAQATKPGFSAYATSKSALHGLTRALAVDLGPKIRVVTLAPAATATSMLKAGFEGSPELYQSLLNVHPLGRIAEPMEIARLAIYLCGPDAGFLTGTTLYADGGILSRLHDPA